MNADGKFLFFSVALSGVLQGDPSSGTLFVIALNPCVELLNQTCRPNEIVRAFADDIAAVLEHLSSLKVFHGVFRLISLCSGMKIKAAKCVIILLGHATTEAVVARSSNTSLRTYLGGQTSR